MCHDRRRIRSSTTMRRTCWVRCPTTSARRSRHIWRPAPTAGPASPRSAACRRCSPGSPRPTSPRRPPPETLLPGLMRRARRSRHRQRWLVAGLGAVAAACVIALAVVAWPFGSSDSGSGAAGAACAPRVAERPGTRRPRAWSATRGARRSSSNAATPRVSSRAGRTNSSSWIARDTSEDLGSWQLPPDADIAYTAGTALQPAEISRVQITTADGTPILELTNS